MDFVYDPITLINLILCIVIVILSIFGYMKIRYVTPLLIGAAFFLFGISHVFTLLGLTTAFKWELIVIRTLAYLSVCAGVFLIIRDIMLRMNVGDELATALNNLEYRVEERTHELFEVNTLLNEVGEMAQVGGWELDVRTKAVRWTKETYRIHDISEDENFELSTAVLFFDLPDRSTLEAALKRCMDLGEPFDLDRKSVV
jgi:hypothetical protein